jgi:predicted ATP-grasp superfamily ATP-dependent carboligase
MTWKGLAVMGSGTALSILVHEWVTGGGLAGEPLPECWADQGRAMRRAIAADFAHLTAVRVITTLDARLAAEPGPWTVARIGGGASARQVHDLARTVDVTILVAPETNGILASLTRELETAGALHLGSSPEAVALAGDKSRLANRLRSLGFETPATITINPAAGVPASAVYPAVLKPVDGAGSVDTYFVPDRLSLPAAARQMPSAVLQPFVPGEPLSASFLVDSSGRAWLVGIGLQHMIILDGCFEYQGGTIPASCRAAESQLRPVVEMVTGLRGFVGVDFIWDAVRQVATLIEINPRPTTSYVGLSRLLGAGRLATAWLEACRAADPDLAVLGALADHVHSEPCLSFGCDGEVQTHGEGQE